MQEFRRPTLHLGRGTGMAWPARALAAVALMLWLVWGCASTATATASGPIAAAVKGQAVLLPPDGGAEYYDTRPSPDPIRGGAVAKEVAEGLQRFTKEQGIELEGDGKLAALGRWVGEHLDSEGRVPPASAIEFAARHLGIAEPIPIIVVMPGDAKAAIGHLEETLRSAPQSIGYNRFGVSEAPRDQGPVTVVVLSSVGLEIAPVARRVAPGAAIRVKGVLKQGFRGAHLAVMLPDGSTQTLEEGRGRDVDSSLVAQQTGVHRVEVLARGAFGVSVVANFPVYVGVAPPVSIEVSPRMEGEGALTVPEVRRVLLGLLNDSRKAAGVEAVEEDLDLTRIADSHSKDMADQGFIGHQSPTTGDAMARVKKAGFQYPLVAENVGWGTNAQEVHRALLDSPGHRANLLNPKLTHVGVGVVVAERGGRSQIFATQLFVRRARPVDVARAPGQVLEQINQARKAAGRAPLQIDPWLSSLAASSARLPLEHPDWTTSRSLDVGMEPTGKTLAQRPKDAPRIQRLEGYLSIVPTLQDVDFPSALDPAVALVGVGVAQGPRPQSGPHTLVVALIVAWKQ